MKTNLLINESPLQVLPTLASKIGLNEAIVLQQLHYWLSNPKSAGKVVDGKKWIFNTYEEWQENFPFWSVRTIARIFANLEDSGLVVSEQFNKGTYDRTKFYTIDYDKLGTIEDANLSCSLIESETTTETTTKTTTKTTTENINSDPIAQKLSEHKCKFNPNSGVIIQGWKDDFSDEIILRAIDDAAGRGKCSIPYIDAIILGWKTNGVPPTRDERAKQARKPARPDYFTTAMQQLEQIAASDTAYTGAD